MDSFDCLLHICSIAVGSGLLGYELGFGTLGSCGMAFILCSMFAAIASKRGD